MEFRDLKKQYQLHKAEIDAAMQNVLMSSHFIGGEQVGQLEEKLADYVGIKHCITCANGTDALQLALMAWDIREGDAVFVPDFTFFSTAEVVPWLRATPIFVDVDKDTFNISPQSLEEAIQAVIEQGNLTPRAVIPVDLFGQPADLSAVKSIAEKYNLLLLEDGAQGFGGRIGESKACSFGDISTTSFFPAKPLGCYGDGGAVFTDNDEWAKLIRSYKVHGKGENKYDNVRIGLNSRLDTLQAAVLLAKFDSFVNEELVAVNRIAARYTEKLDNIVETPIVLEGYVSSWAQYTIKLKDCEQRNAVQKYLANHDIPSMVYYPKPLHKQEAFSGGIDWGITLQNTDDICDRVLSIPMHPYMSDKDCDYVAENIKNAVL